MALKQTVNDNFYNFVRSMDPSPDLLHGLRSVTFVKDQITDIEQRVTDDRKNNELLKTLVNVPDDILESVMNGFISALRSSGQDHVANILRRESDKVIMSDEHYKLLRKERPNLCKFMNPKDELIDHLISLEILSGTDNDRILSKSELNDMAKETVNILMRKSDCCFGKFVDALNTTNQSHVSYLLTGVGNPPMSDEHRKLLLAKMHFLENFTDTENGLLTHLLSHEVITLQDTERIRSMTNENTMARLLVEILLRKSDDAFFMFIASLVETGQTHVAYILTGEGKSPPLEEKHRKRLLSNPRGYLVKTIESKNSGLTTVLMDKGVFSIYDQQRVQRDIHDERNEVILNLIARKSQSDFFKFISALIDTGQKHVVEELIGADVVAKIKTVYESGASDRHVADVDKELLEYMRGMFQSNGESIKKLNEKLAENGVSVSNVRKGSIEVTFTCESIQALQNLRHLNDSGQLENMLNEAFCSPFAKKSLKSLAVVISNDQFEQWIPMSSEHHEALLSSEEGLVGKMVITDDLLDRLTLCKRRRHAIECAATREQQVKTLLDIVSRQPDSAFQQLLNALHATHQTEAVDIISGDTKRGRVSEDSQLQMTHAWKEFDNESECLDPQQVIKMCYEDIDLLLALKDFLVALRQFKSSCGEPGEPCFYRAMH